MAKPIEVATLVGQNQQTVILNKILRGVTLILLILRNGGVVSPELEAAFQELQAEVQAVDDKVKDTTQRKESA